MTSKIFKQIVLVAMLCMSATFADAQVSRLTVKGTNIVDSTGKTVKLCGVCFAWHNWWGEYFNPQFVDELKDGWHCNVVRASIGVGHANDYIENPEYAQQCIDNVVQEAIKKDMYVIIDFHSHILKQKEAVTFFTTQAEKYGKYPNVIFELFNEPIDQKWSELTAYAKAVSKAIRKYSDNVILMGTPHWDQSIMMAADKPIKGIKNLMYTVHFYANTHKEALRESTETAIKKGIPVFISECGSMSADGGGMINHEEFDKWVELIDKYDIPMVLWSIADKDETCSMLKPRSKSDKLSDTSLTEWGLMAKQFVINRNF